MGTEEEEVVKMGIGTLATERVQKSLNSQFLIFSMISAAFPFSENYSYIMLRFRNKKLFSR